MKKRHQNSKRQKVKEQNALKTYNKTIAMSADDVIRDYSHLSRLRVSESRRDWIETTMYNLRVKANKCERNVLAFFRKKNIPYIHQAPFIIDGKIYFADFYIEPKNLIIEIDGKYHSYNTQRAYDRTRDLAFGGYSIKTVRISNEVAMDTKKLEEVYAAIDQQYQNRIQRLK